MKLLFSSMFLYEYSTDMIAKAAKLAEIDGVEFWPETPHFWVDRDENKLRCFKGMCMAIHAPVLDLNPVSINEKLCNLTIEESLYAINLASKLDAKLVTFHAGKRSAKREPVWADYLSLHRYLRILKNYAAIKNVPIALENSEPNVNNLCKRADEISEFLKKYDIYFTFDIKHALVSGNAEKFIDLAFDRIANVHVSYFDSQNHHVEPSKGEEVGKILKVLSDYGYDSIVTIELDDLGIGNIEFSKKVEILKREANFVRSFF